MRRAHSKWLVAAGTALVLAACAGPGGFGRPAVSEAEQSAFDAARALEARNPQAAERALIDFVGQYPESALADDASRALAGLARERGDVETEAHWLYTIVREYPSGDQAPAARVELAQLEAERGDPEAARRLLTDVRISRLEDAEQRRAYRLQSELAENGAERLGWLASLRAAVEDDPDPTQLAAVDDAIDGLVAALSVDDLEQAADQLGRRPPAGRVHLELARRALDSGDTETARDDLERAWRSDLAPVYAASADRLAAEIERREQLLEAGGGLPAFRDVAALPPPDLADAQGTLGVVLPLSGPFAAYGEACLRGIMLAAGIFEPDAVVDPVDAELAARGIAWSDEPAPRVRLRVRDSGGEPGRAAQAVRELASDGDVVAIIGPLLSSVSEAAAAVAEDEGVPLLALSSREEVAAARPHVLRLRTTPRDEVDYLVSYAIDDIGARRFAILYPSDNYGRGMRDRFWQAVDAHSAWVVAVAGYDPEATDFAEPIRSLVGYDLLTADERKALDERSEALRKARRLPPEEAAELRETLYSEPGPEGDPLPPVVDFDAIFIPDSHDNVVLIAPQLAFHEVTGVRLLGTGDWMHPDLLRIARRHVRGAVIAAPFHAESEFAFVARFVDDYAQTFGDEPDLFAAHGFDAANLLLTQLAANRTTRDELLDGVLRTRGYPGVSGVTTVLPDGNARKRPYLLGVKGGQIVPLD